MFTLGVHVCFALFGVLMWFTVTCYLQLLILLLSIQIYYFGILPILQVLVDIVMFNFVFAILMHLYLRNHSDYSSRKVLQHKGYKTCTSLLSRLPDDPNYIRHDSVLSASRHQKVGDYANIYSRASQSIIPTNPVTGTSSIMLPGPRSEW